MNRHIVLKKLSKGFVSLLLVFAVMVSLLVPFDISVFADEEPATGENLYLFIYKAKKTDGSFYTYSGHDMYDFIFQKGNTPPYPDRETVKIPVYNKNTKTYDNLDYLNDFDDDQLTNKALGIGKEEYKHPWYDFSYYCKRLYINDKIAPRKMTGWFMNMRNLTDENCHGLEDNIDTSGCTSFRYLFNYCYLKHLDLTAWDTGEVTDASGMFSHQEGRGLETINISNWEFPKLTTGMSNFIYDSLLRELDLSGLKPTVCDNFVGMLQENKKLEKVKFGDFKAAFSANYQSMFSNDISLESVYSTEPVQGTADMSSWTSSGATCFATMFKNCKLIKNVDFGENIKCRKDPSGNIFESTFEGCDALEFVNLSCATGPICSKSTFKNCSLLKEVVMDRLETTQNSNASNLTGKDNIFEGCDELSRITLNNGWPKNNKGGTSIPPKATWKKIDEPNKGKELSNEELFLKFGQSGKGEAGTWVAEAKINLNANGGSPKYQSIDGARGMDAEFDGSVTASRTGYIFDGWYTQKTGGNKLEDGKPLESWTYYAHWKEIKYNLTLYGNDGIVPAGFSAEGATVSQDRDKIVFNNINYTQFVALSSNMFTNPDGAVLASWNIRKNGTSTEFAANDSVNKLAVNDGDMAELYAQWHTPEAVITFDSQGGSSVASRDYNIGDRYGTLSVPSRDGDAQSPAGYTFIGWFTETDGGGYEIVDKDDEDVDNTKEQNKVTATRTLYALWQPNCAVTFNANGGTIQGAGTSGKVCQYGQKLGALPTPEKGSATFQGWYTAQNGGDKVTSATIVKSPTVTYYAHWAYQPKFETGGGSYLSYPQAGYAAQTSTNYTVTVLPTVEKYRCKFLGWFADEDGDGEYEKEVKANTSVNLSNNCVIKAKWKDDPTCTITLDADGGTIPNNENSINVYKGGALAELPVPVKSGYSFDGWYDSTENAAWPGVELTDKTANYLNQEQFTATFEERFTKIIFSDGTNVNQTVDITYDSSKAGYYPYNEKGSDGKYEVVSWEEEASSTPGMNTVKFTNIHNWAHVYLYAWCDEADAKVNEKTKVYTDKTLTAKWVEKDCTVTFNPNGGELYNQSEATVNVVAGKTVPVIPGAIRKEEDGSVKYFFDGWYPNADGTGDKLTSDTKINNGITYYAKWTDPQQYVLIDDEGATTMQNQLYMYSVCWGNLSDGSVTNSTGDNLVFHPTSSGNISAYLRMQFYCYDNTTSTDITIPAGAVKIKIPKYVFKNRSGNNIGTNNIDVGLADHPTENADFYYNEVTENGETYYVLINNVELTGKHNDFKIFYEANPAQIAGGYIDENGYYQYVEGKKYFENNINVNVNVDINKDGDTDEVKELNKDIPLSLEVHTKVNTTVAKTQSSVSLKWNSTWGSKPADADEYYYVTWELSSSHFNSNQPFTLSWSEDTVRDGAIIVPPDNSNAERSAQTYTTTVVTKHRRDTVEKTETGWANAHNEAVLTVTWKSGHVQHFRASADAYAYIEPPTSGGSNSFRKYIDDDDYSENDSHYIQGGQELIQANDIVPLKYRLCYTESKRDVTPTWYENSGTYSVPRRTFTITDGDSGDVVISSISKNPLPHESDWNQSRDTKLNESDYYFDSLDVSIIESDTIKMNDIWSNPFPHEDANDYDDDGVIISIRRAGSSEIETLKPIIHKAGDTVDLPNDTVWFKVQYSSNFYTTDITVKPTLCLKPTNHIKSIVQDHIESNVNSIVKNKGTIKTAEKNKADITSVSGTEGASGWYSAYVLNIGESRLYAAKSCGSGDKVVLDNENASESFPVVVSGWGYNTTGNKKPMKSAMFYDLLPEGYTVNRDSVFIKPRTDNASSSTALANNYDTVKNGGGLLPSAYYTVNFSDNYKDSGRSMMTVEVNIPSDQIATGVDVYYKMNTTYANVIVNGTTPPNFVAYKDTTPGQSLPVQRIGDLGTIEPKFKPCYDEAESEQTAYTSAKINAKSPSIISSGLSSVVKTEGISQQTHQIIGRNTDYSYVVSFRNDNTYTSENLVLYDLIERKVGGSDSEWYGEFLSLDISGIKNTKDNANKYYCAPVVYYSTHENFTEEEIDISNDSIWTTTMPPKNQITAIAVDCRKTTNNTDYVLPKQKGLSFEIRMHSPTNVDNDQTAYNEAYVRGNLTGAGTRVDNLTQTSVTVHFNVPKFVKEAFPGPGTAETPETVVENSMLEYVLKITNPDKDVPMCDVIVEDILSDKVRASNSLTYKINDEASVSIESAAGVTYSLSPADNGKTRFEATIETIKADSTVEITIPVTVIGKVGDGFTNTAQILSESGIPYNTPVESDTTYHTIGEIQAKILKTNSKGKPLAGATLQILDKNKNIVTLTDNNNNQITQFTSTNKILRFNLNPGKYYLRELNAPTDFNTYNEDIEFRIDSEGIIYVNNQAVNYVEMKDTPTYKVIFHENNPEIDDKNVVFKTYEPNELNNDKSITHFYDIPEWAGDEYVFGGWFHNAGYTESPNETTAANFESDKYPRSDEKNPQDYHLYAKWIKVGTVGKSNDDPYEINTYRGFGLAGVQIRHGRLTEEDEMFDSNYGGKTHGGMRFVTSLKESLLSDIDALSSQKVNTPEGNVNVEYGYAVGKEDNINAFIEHYNVADTANYRLQYKGDNVNGVNTTGTNTNERTADTDYRYITNVNCTRGIQVRDKQGKLTGTITDDHRNFKDYRLYTLVVSYDEEGSQAHLDDKIDARSYIRYVDANGKLRVFYNDYRNNNRKTYFGGCMCSYNQVADMAISQNQSLLDQQQQMNN